MSNRRLVVGGVAMGLVLFGCAAVFSEEEISDPASTSTTASTPQSTAATPSATRSASPTQEATSSPPPASPSESATRAPLPPPAVSPAPENLTVAVTRVVDGDTIETSAGTVRLIGIDTPERGECNYQAATQELAGALAAHGNAVVLTAKPGEDTDKYGRLLRYVDSAQDGTDFNLHMVSTGLAISRYDSRDGYGAHPREPAYISTDAANDPAGCAVTQTPAPFAAAQPAAPAPAPVGGGEPWNMPGPDLDCSDIGHLVYITGPDYHRLDRDGDGVGCDSYG